MMELLPILVKSQKLLQRMYSVHSRSYFEENKNDQKKQMHVAKHVWRGWKFGMAKPHGLMKLIAPSRKIGTLFADPRDYKQAIDINSRGITLVRNFKILKINLYKALELFAHINGVI